MKPFVLSFLLCLGPIFGASAALASEKSATILDLILDQKKPVDTGTIVFNEVDLSYNGQRMYACSTHPSYVGDTANWLCRYLGFSQALDHKVVQLNNDHISDEILWVIMEKRSKIKMLPIRKSHLPKRRHIFVSLTCAR